MKATTKVSKIEVGFEKQADGRIKLWPVNQPAHHEFLSQADFDARFDIVPETPTTTTT